MNKFLLPLLACFSLSAAAQDWPAFRGPYGNDGHAEASMKLPMTWSKDKNVPWRVGLPGRGWSTPIIVGGKIYLTTAVAQGDEADSKSPQSLRALCVSAADGKVLWNVEVFTEAGSSTPTIHEKNSHASPSPVLAGDRLFVHFGHQGTACLDLNGKKIWEQRSVVYPPMHGNAATPVLVDGLLIFPCDGERDPFIAALNAETGAVAWRTPRLPSEGKLKFSFSSPEWITVDGKKQILSPATDGLYVYDPATGKDLWHVKYDGYSVIPKPVFGNGLVYFSSGFMSGKSYAVRPGGSGDVTATSVVWVQNKRGPTTPSMVLNGDELYTVADNGIASCLDSKTGEIQWQERTARGCSASPFIHGDHLYILDEYGTTTILRASRKFEKLASNSLEGEHTLASPVPADGALFIRSEKALYRIQE